MRAETRIRLAELHREVRDIQSAQTVSLAALKTSVASLNAEATVALAEAVETLAAVLNRKWFGPGTSNLLQEEE